MSTKSTLTYSQLRSLDIAARVSACLSLVGTSFTLTSYISYRPLRKPFNRLAFCIATANAFGCLAYSWGIHPIYYGRNSAFCQTQAFFIEWFVMTDPFLALVMATSVWLRICAKRSVDEIKLFENVGVACAFTLPFIPALVFLIWRPRGLTVYGPAGMWCWVSNESNLLRLVAFYAPIWAMILGSIMLFVLSGRRILHVRAKVLKAQAMHETEQKPRRFSVGQFSWMKSISRSEADQPLSNSSNSIPPRGEEEPPTPTPWNATSGAHTDPEELMEAPTHTDSMDTSTSCTIGRSSYDTTTHLRHRHTRFDTMHWKYARFAFLCTIVLFITWVPISINRIYNNFIDPNNPIYGLYFASALCIPLHGFGNFVIYVNTSWVECRAWVLSLISRTESEKRQSSATSSRG